MAKAVHTVLHVPMEERSIGLYPETFGNGAADRMDFNGFTPGCLRNDEDNVNVKFEPAINENLKEPRTSRNAYGNAIEEISMGPP